MKRFISDSGVLVFGHRGNSMFFPENTMESFASCADNPGISGIELDVHLTSDGIPVVAHDFTLMRTAGINRRISDMTWEELRCIDVGSFKDSSFSSARVPLLSDVFREFGRRFYYDIEIKSFPFTWNCPLCRKTLSEIRSAGLEDRVSVSSFNPLSLRYFGRICDHSIDCADIFSRSKDVPFFLRNGGGHFYSRSTYIKPQYTMLDDFIKNRFQSMCMCVWTVNDADAAATVLDKKSQGFNICGVIGNDPSLLSDMVSDAGLSVKI